MNAVFTEPDPFDPFADCAVERVVPTSQAQREVWLADRLGPQASLAFNESVGLRLRGALDLQALRGALDALVARHESLRATFGPDGTQMLVGAAAPLDLAVADLRALDAAGQRRALDDAAAQAVLARFDLAAGPLVRASLHRLADDDQVLMLSAHHIVCDGWSWGVIVADLAALYAEQLGIAPAPEPAARYGDYVEQELREAGGPEAAASEAYWLGRFAGGSLPVLDLPTDRPRPRVRGFASRRIDHELDADLVAGLRRLGAAAGASLFAALFAGFAATLRRLTGQDDLVVGVPAAGQAARDMPALVGHCVNLLPVRVAVPGELPFEQVVRGCGGALLDAFEHQSMTYATLLGRLAVPRDPGRLPLVSVMFNLDAPLACGPDAFDGLRMDLHAHARQFENFELFVNAVPAGGALRLECQYATALFDADTVARWLGAFEALLRDTVRDATRPVAALDWVTRAERERLHALQPAPVPLPSPALMHEAIVRQAAATPQRTALRAGDAELTYAALEARANRLAHALRARGIGRGERVGLCLARNADMVVALLAVLKAGAAYVPLDPDFPQARLDYYAQDAGLALLLTDSTVTTAPRAWRDDASQRVLALDLDAQWLEQPDGALPADARDAAPDDAAYVIYTSGSTGRPKGVCVPHRAAANFLAAMRTEPGIGCDDRLAAVTTLSFDIAVLELLLPLTVGAQTIVVPRETVLDAARLRALLADSGATMMQATPGTWQMLLDAGWQGAAGFAALVGGESLPPDLARALLDRAGRVWNLYGPTETTVWSTAWQVERAALERGGVSIGRPIANTTVWVLDEAGQPCPAGVPGELCIGGEGVAIGYLDRPELTAERFVADPFAQQPGARLYRTGDRGRWRNDGLLEHLGRLDFQVKVRGYRIELGEIEAACAQCRGVAQSVVLAREDRPGDVRLVAYLVAAAGGHPIDERALRAHLRDTLPAYMLPQHVLVLAALPRLPNGKIDRKALPAPQAEADASARERTLPADALQGAVLAAVEAVLGLPGLDMRDDFFALGGHSLLAARLVARLARDLGVELPLRTLFEAPTALQLAQAVEHARAAGAPARTPIEHRPGRRSAPLTVMQERIRFIEELHPGRVVYNVPSAHRLTGPMDAERFERALRAVVARQPALRTRIARDATGQGWCQAIDDAVDVELPLTDLSTLPASAREAELMRRMQAIVDTPIDIHRAPLFRAALWRLSADEHAFLFMPHHLIWDGWSFDLFYDEMAAQLAEPSTQGAAATRHDNAAAGQGAAAAGRGSQAPHGRVPVALPVTYGDYAEWHAQWLQGSECAAQLRYWKERFARAPACPAPRADQPGGAGMTGRGGVQWVRLDEALTARLREAARAAGVTLNMLALAVYAAMLTSATGGAGVVVGVPVRGRLAPEIEPVMGFFNNLLPVQLQVDPSQDMAGLVRGIKRELLDVFTHQDVPFERLAAEPEIAARSRGAGLYHALFSYQDARERTRRWGALDHRMIQVFQKGATEDLGLWLVEQPDGLVGAFIYNADRHAEATAVALRERYLELLTGLVDDPAATVATLTDPAGSAAARHLRRLGADAVRATDVARPAEADPRTGAQPSIDPAPSDAGSNAAQRDASPSTESPAVSLEAGLAGIWSALLDTPVDQIRPDDNFFDLGGDSLLAMQAIEASQRAFGFRVDARRYIFESLAQLASPQAALALAQSTAGQAPAGFCAADAPPRPLQPAPAAELPGAVPPRNRLARLIAGFGRKARSAH